MYIKKRDPKWASTYRINRAFVLMFTDPLVECGSKSFKRRVIEYYSKGTNECAICKTKDDLTVDHINGNGKENRQNMRYKSRFYRTIIENGFPAGYRILCRKCNAKEWMNNQSIFVIPRRYIEKNKNNSQLLAEYKEYLLSLFK